MKYKIIMAFLMVTLMISSVFSSTNINIDSNENSKSPLNTAVNKPDFQKFDYQKSVYLPRDYHSPIMQPLPGGTSLDQYQTYGDCWVDTNYNVTKIAQRFKPTLDNLDYVELKVWLNFTSPTIDIFFYICEDDENIPGALVVGGSSNSYTSSDFYYSSSVPDPNNDNECPWYIIEFPNDPQLTPDSLYWIVMAINVQLSNDKHVCLAGYDGDLYSDGYIAWWSSDYGWEYDLNEFDIDLMFKTYSFSNQSNMPKADAGDSYYGYVNGGETVDFNGTGSYDNDEGGESIVQYDWKFYDGDEWHTNYGATPTYSYSTAGTYTVMLRVHDDEGDTAIDAATVTIYPPGPPHVNYVKSLYADGSDASDGKGMLLQGIDLINTYTASIAGTGVDKVEFTFGEESYTDTNGNDGWSASFNMEDIQDTSDTLKVRAHNQYGWGDEEGYDPIIIGMPSWLFRFTRFTIQWNGTLFATISFGAHSDPYNPEYLYWTVTVSVDLSLGSPEDPEESPMDAEVPGGVPVEDVGGDYSYKGGIGSSVYISGDGTIDVSGRYVASITTKSLGGGIGVSLHGVFTIDDGIQWHLCYLTVNGYVTIPIFSIPLIICGYGVRTGIDITPSAQITIYLEPSEGPPDDEIVPQLGIKIRNNAGITGSVAARIRAYAEVGFGLGSFYAEAGGSGTLTFQTPRNPSYFKNFVLSAWIGARLRITFWTFEGWYTYNWMYINTIGTGKDYTETDWTPLDRDYLNPDSGEYNEFDWNGENGPFIVNAFPYASPSTAYFPNSAGTKTLIVWSHDNEEKSKVKGMELQYTIWDKDDGMNTPQVIPGTDDDKLQMDPKIAFDSDGDAVCVFIQTDNSINENSNMNDVCDATEIAYSVWDHNSETWSAVITITNNNRMDVSPVLASNENGDIILVWMTDNDNDHTTINDRTIYSSLWDGNSWSTPQIIAQNKPITTTPQVAINDNRGEAICVFTMDGDNDPTTSLDQNIHYTTFTPGGSGGNIIQFTNDNQFQDTAPSVVYGQDGNAYIVWLKNEYDEYQNQEIHEGTLYYKEVGSSRTDAFAITNGSISDPMIIPSQGSVKGDNFNFAVGWGGGKTSYTLNCAKISTNNEIESGAIYGSKDKLSETNWCIAPGAITAITVERPVLKEHNKNCNLSFICANGFDDIPPTSECTIIGDNIGYGAYGPIYNSDITITLEAYDEGGSGLENLFYRLDSGAEQIYNGTSIKVSAKKPHVLRFYSRDKAGNIEEIQIQQFQIVDTLAPIKPLQPAGPTRGKVGDSYMFSTRATDPELDQIYYKWSWGNDFSEWIGPYKSGEYCFVEHTWERRGSYEVKVIAKDSPHGRESEWSDPLEVTIPRSRPYINTIFLRFLEQFPNAFPLLRYILGL